MKLHNILLLFNIIQCAFADFSDTVNVCRDCEVIQTCHIDYGQNEKIPVYPPDNNGAIEVGKCICNPQNIAKYKKCIPCYYTHTNKNNPPKDASIDKECKRVLGDTSIAGNNPTAVSGANEDTGTTAGTTTGTTTGTTGAAGAAGAAGVTNGSQIGNGITSSNSQFNGNNQQPSTVNNQSTEDKGKGKSSKTIMFSIIGIVLVVGAVGFFVYNSKKKERPESMPFFGNTASSPNKFSSLDPRNSNPTMSYNSTPTYNTLQYSSTSPLKENQYYQSNYDSPPPYENQYGQYQSSDYQFQQYENNNNAATAVATEALAPNSHDSVNYDQRRESMNHSTNQPSVDNVNANESIYTCTYPYDPKLDDELELKIDDQIQILEEFEDGWMKAINLTTKKEGMAPIVCVKPTTN